MNDEYMSASQAAEYLGITRQRVNQLGANGKIARYEIGGYIVYRRDELDRWKQEPRNKGGRPKDPALATTSRPASA